MKKTTTTIIMMICILMVSISGCRKTEADILGIVSTEEVENLFGTTVKVHYSNSTKMYFHLLSDTTAEVVNSRWFYTEEGETAPWVYRGDVVVPARFVHGGKMFKVTCIGEGCFWESTGPDGIVNLISSVELPNTIDTIRKNAFYTCKNMTSITIPNSVRYIGENAFCESGLTSLTLPESVEYVGKGAFCNTDLTTFELPQSFEKIPASMFRGCVDMTSVKLHDRLTNIGDYAFSWTGVSSFEIPASVKELGMGVLYDSRSLKTLVCLPVVPPVKDPNSNYPEDYLIICDSLETVYVPMQSVEAYKESPQWRLYKDIIVGMQ